jgi:AraC-like DNA-binding protein
MNRYGPARRRTACGIARRELHVAVRFDVESLAPNDRAEAVRELSRAVNGRIEVDLPPNPAHVRAVTTTSVLGPAEISDIQWNVVGLRRTAGPLSDDVEPHVFVGLQESGVSRFAQGGRQAEIRPGDLIVLENVKPYTVSFRGNVKTFSIRVPTRVLGLRSSLLGRITAVRLGPERPVVDAAGAFFSRLVRNQTAVGEADAELVAEPCLELIRAVVATSLGRDDLAREPLQHTLLQRVTTYVRLHLPERDLSAAQIASEHHVSVRQLYLTLSRAGISLGDWIRTQRLEECKRELSSSAHQFMTIEAIAHRWGFASASHFGRVFRAAYGVSPREWRGGTSEKAEEKPWPNRPGDS